jgi:hypothetical protein
MKRITRLMSVCAITIAIVSMTSCKKGDTGPAGPAGPAGAAGAAGAAGPIGPTGQTGNANVTQYVFVPVDANNTLTGVDLTKGGVEAAFLLANDTLDKCAWFAYLFNFTSSDFSTTGTVAIPGIGFDNKSSYSFQYFNGLVNHDSAYFDFITAVAPGEIYDGIKLVRVLLSNANAILSTRGGSGNNRGLPNIDFKNYAEVKKYYNLP